jgi:hypothetical protein
MVTRRGPDNLLISLFYSRMMRCGRTIELGFTAPI